MNFHSIKIKITCGYSVIIILVFTLVLAGAAGYSSYYGEAVVKEELLDEVKDLQEDILRYPEYFPDGKLTVYYDDGVMLSLYDENGHLMNGVFPDEFPTDIPFEEEKVRKIQNASDSWFLYDRKITDGNGSSIWIRGIHSYSSVMISYQRQTLILSIIFPLLAVFTAFLGYRMIGRSLKSVHAIIATVNSIASSHSLSERVPLPRAKDEFYELSVTFNRMLGQMEQNFDRERQFSSDAAHELRTPVAVILSHCEYCLEELNPKEEVREQVWIIQKKAKQMSELVSGLLAISRGEQGRVSSVREEVDLSLLAETVVEELEERADKKEIEIQLENELEDPLIQGDMSKLTRMFINLVDNSISYGKVHGFVRITMEEQGAQVCIKFHDNGIGMTKKELQHIWDRFYRGDQSRGQSEGFGLGLCLVKQIVEAHGGSIAAESEPGRGSTFTVLLPREAKER